MSASAYTCEYLAGACDRKTIVGKSRQLLEGIRELAG